MSNKNHINKTFLVCLKIHRYKLCEISEHYVQQHKVCLKSNDIQLRDLRNSHLEVLTSSRLTADLILFKKTCIYYLVHFFLLFEALQFVYL